MNRLNADPNLRQEEVPLRFDDPAGSIYPEIVRAHDQYLNADYSRFGLLARRAGVLSMNFVEVAGGGRGAQHPELERQRDRERASVGLPLKWTIGHDAQPK